MRIRIVTVAVLAIAAAGAHAQGQDASSGAPLLLEVAARGYAGDRAASMAGDSSLDKVESYIWADRTLCAMGAGQAPPVVVPWIGWHVTGAVTGVVRQSDRDSMVARVEWQRVWQDGSRLQDGPKGQIETAIRDGERVELDRVVQAEGNAGACGMRQIRLEAGVITKPAYRIGVVGAGTGGVAGGRGGRGSGGGAGARAGGTGAQASAATAEELQSRALEILTTAKAARSPVAYDAELWMVHRHPDGTETVQQQTVRFMGQDQAFTFPPITVPTTKGEMTLDIGGALRATADPSAAATDPTSNRLQALSYYFNSGYRVAGGTQGLRLVLSISRRARASGARPLDTRGGSYFFLDIPSASDVLSFEFPSLQKATEDLLKGHTFSLRIRVTPVGK